MVAIKTLIALSPFVVGFAAAGNSVYSWSPYNDNSHSSTSADVGGINYCGMHRRQGGQTNINSGAGAAVGNNCRRSELLEEHLEARDIDAGFDALDAMMKRGNSVYSWSPYTDSSTSNTNANVHGLNFCRRQSGGQNNFNTGAGAAVANNCRRSEELAIKDLGAVYRRMVERDFTPEQAEEGAEFLRRHAEELGLVRIE